VWEEVTAQAAATKALITALGAAKQERHGAVAGTAPGTAPTTGGATARDGANALARAKQEADSYLAAKRRLAAEAVARREAREAEARQATKEARQRRESEEAEMAEAEAAERAEAERRQAQAARVAKHEARLATAEAAARAATQLVAHRPATAAADQPASSHTSSHDGQPTSSHTSSHDAPAVGARRPATARPVSAAGGSSDLPIALARHAGAPPTTTTTPREEAPSGASAQDGASGSAEGEGSAASAPPSGELAPIAALPSLAAAGTVAKRLAAAKANPQLGRTLDPNSKLEDNYSLLGVLGKGSYGEVRLAIHKLTKQRVAVKTLTRAKLTDEKLRKRAAVEVKLHARLYHPNIARLYEVLVSPAAICLCMHYAAGGTLRDVLDQHGALSERRARSYAQQLCGALHYCHRSAHIAHRDLKLDNLLLDANGRLLLADFGFAEYVGPTNRKLRLLCGSPHYSAPEIFAQQEYSGTAADMWSLGVLLYTMLAGHFPFQADSMEGLGKKVMKGKPDQPLKAPETALELVGRLLVVRASQRADIDETCRHPWLAPGPTEPPIDTSGLSPAPTWDEAVAAKLEAMGCPTALVQHHVNALAASGTSNHVTAAYEILLQAERAGATNAELA